MDNLTSKEEIPLHCPFCGAAPNSHSYSIGGKSFAWIRCEDCKIGKELHTDGEELRLQLFAMESVIRWWNRRSLSRDSSAVETSPQPTFVYAGNVFAKNDEGDVFIDWDNEHHEPEVGTLLFMRLWTQAEIESAHKDGEELYRGLTQETKPDDQDSYIHGPGTFPHSEGCRCERCSSTKCPDCGVQIVPGARHFSGCKSHPGEPALKTKRECTGDECLTADTVSGHLPECPIEESFCKCPEGVRRWVNGLDCEACGLALNGRTDGHG